MKPSPQWAYFAQLRQQAPHVAETIRQVIARDQGRHAPSDEEVAKYCELYRIKQPEAQWWV